MRHLTIETLARIADGPATEEERAHLTECAECATELAALEDQTAALADLPPPAAPPAVWRRVEAALAAGHPADALRRRRAYVRRALQAAAAVAVFAGGAAVGAGFERNPASSEAHLPMDDPRSETATVATAEPRPERPNPVETAEEPPVALPRPVVVRRAAVEEPPPADPEAALREAAARYRDALARFTEERGAAASEDPTSRLAALEGILHTTRAALDEVPDDPVLEGFYRSALAQREAILSDVTITTAQAVY
ncbi:MAG: hypothetical protein KY397_03610 [Gemmatimonadetes bacterium]|nr:hypothetical protein [Gemmatimonadota bacterium]